MYRRAGRDGDASFELGARVADALWSACHPREPVATSVLPMGGALLAVAGEGAMPVGVGALPRAEATTAEVDALVVRLYDEHAASLVRLVRLFVDDRNAAEDLVQEAFIRLARNVHRISEPHKAAAYLRSIVLNLARDHNRRGLVSLRHHVPADDVQSTFEDEVVLRDDQRQVIDALRELPLRQRDCVVLRYYFELGVPDIAETLGISANSVKTHLKRGLAALGRTLGVDR